MYNYNSLNIYIDGSSFGNPGESGVGIILCQDEHTIKNISKFIGNGTNNVAEYKALIFALTEASEMRAREIQIFSDSELLCKQIKGEYKVKNEELKKLFAQALDLIKNFNTFKIKQIPRENNRGADKLARLAIKNRKSKIDGIAACSTSSAQEESPGSKGQRSG